MGGFTVAAVMIPSLQRPKSISLYLASLQRPPGDQHQLPSLQRRATTLKFCRIIECKLQPCSTYPNYFLWLPEVPAHVLSYFQVPKSLFSIRNHSKTRATNKFKQSHSFLPFPSINTSYFIILRQPKISFLPIS